MVLKNMDLGEACVAEERAMLIGSEESPTGDMAVFLRHGRRGGAGAFVDFRDEDEASAGFEDAEDFVDVAGEVRPEEVRLDGSSAVEGGVGQGSSETEPWRMSTGPRSAAAVLNFWEAATLASE
jgi:hypothetical protein